MPAILAVGGVASKKTYIASKENSRITWDLWGL